MESEEAKEIWDAFCSFCWNHKYFFRQSKVIDLHLVANAFILILNAEIPASELHIYFFSALFMSSRNILFLLKSQNFGRMLE